MIIQNEAKCRKCDDIIWSGSRHDFKTCECGAISVDGGMDYIRRVGEPEDIEERSLTTNKDRLMKCVERVEGIKAEKCDENTRTNLMTSTVVIFYAIDDNVDDCFEWTNRDQEICNEAVQWGIETGRNSLGIVLAVIRALRDNNLLDMEKFNNEN